MVLVLTVVVLQSISFANYALTTKTTNIIYGSAPYLTFDGGRTRVTNTEALLGISLSDGRRFTPTTNNSSDNPIVLPASGQSFADIGMLVPTNTNSIALSSLIGTPYNYWGDDDGDGQGVNGVTATGSLNLSIVDNFNNPVTRNEVLTICKAPYKLTLSSDSGTLKTRYGVPNESRFTAGNATYYINPKETTPKICSAQPLYDRWLIDSIPAFPAFDTPSYDKVWGYFTRSVTPSSYDLNFPTTGMDRVYFDLYIGGNNQDLYWEPVTHSGITASMYNSTKTSVEVSLTGPRGTGRSCDLGQSIDRPSLPQVFELVGRDSSGNAVVKYGFVLKKWFVKYCYSRREYETTLSLCSSIGYRVPQVKDLTNASIADCGTYPCAGFEPAEPLSPDNNARRHIGAGFFAEWGNMIDFIDSFDVLAWTANNYTNRDTGVSYPFIVDPYDGRIYDEQILPIITNGMDPIPICVYP
ncbi:hypothetical protein [Gilliamella apis]|uniref:hypothetical protein n=1 Tax=Gilliamella apis TaxID=1970738 RepID=UPI000A34E7BA|nr:hypothetical protein [Gilliamella apis]OTQ57964.1 hypothetical protein B6C98_11105 [Gilliamella apis]OTQ64148.1 hypothetical protein B6D09_08055 [Gilliamella apis]OTQ66671.1 hypothetical protein B6C89_07110 [Gilliamella apis]OTQ68867.1 hypothetical protein B6D10_06010 [Gilliamella apis]